MAPMLQSSYAYSWIDASVYLIIYTLAALFMSVTDIVHFEMIAYSQKHKKLKKKYNINVTLAMRRWNKKKETSTTNYYKVKATQCNRLLR